MGVLSWAVVAHAFNPALGRQRQVDLREFEASLVYKNKFHYRLQCHRETLSQKTNQTKKTNKTKIKMNNPTIETTTSCY